VFTNCTFSANRSTTRGGALYAESGSSQRFINCILWENETAGSTTTSFATVIGSPYAPPPAYFRNCIVANSSSANGWNALSGYDEGGNLSADPRFLVPLSPTAAPSAGGDFQLGYQSPALEAGDNAAVTATTDLANAPRLTNGTVDMGAYEGQNDQFDLDGDGLSDAFELSATSPPSRTALDPNGDGDGDSRSNLLEFAFGLNPLAADQATVSQATVVEHAGSRYLSLRYRQNRWASQLLELSVERSLDPGPAGSWSTGETTRASVRPIGGAVDEITERSNIPIDAQPAEFLRLRIK
jgi:predicted outer membrane repeat protein